MFKFVNQFHLNAFSNMWWIYHNRDAKCILFFNTVLVLDFYVLYIFSLTPVCEITVMFSCIRNMWEFVAQGYQRCIGCGSNSESMEV